MSLWELKPANSDHYGIKDCCEVGLMVFYRGRSKIPVGALLLLDVSAAYIGCDVHRHWLLCRQTISQSEFADSHV
ncbi:hypothetical protein SKAU_G00206550 [Synaphobranchus kaupii]|uniref:Uncharacterized protein n=1 Tax=Synaphobranchus kaupii TaxID=118154 RepID=A0A9Q1FGN0_SYNKA|nr:hypothetical protein SKAU_G00206550 [Synaphobranchus kaupii]